MADPDKLSASGSVTAQGKVAEADHSQMSWRQWWRHVRSEHFRGYRTMIFNGLIAVGFCVAEIVSYLTTLDWRNLIDQKWGPWVAIGLAVANIVLRYWTTGPVYSK